MLSRRFRRLRWLCGVLAFLMFWSGLPPRARAAPAGKPAAPADDPAKRQAAAEKMERLFDALAKAERDIPRETFEPQAIVDRVGTDPVKLFEWVRDHTWWVPYQGALRGPVGVLMDRVGNSMDRSLLLAELLQTAGLNTRLAHATLPQDVASGLVANVRPMPATSPWTGEEDLRPVTDVAALSKEFSLDADLLSAATQKLSLETCRLKEELAAHVTEQAPALAEALEKKPADTNASSARKTQAMRDHWWVQAQKDGQWVDLDPIVPSAQPGNAQARPSETLAIGSHEGARQLGSNVCHEVVVRVVIEQWKDGAFHERKALEKTLRPADLIGVPITLHHVPMDWPQGAVSTDAGLQPKAIETAVLKQKEWLPVLTVGRAVTTQGSFTDCGDVNDTQSTDPAAKVGQAVSKTFGGMGGMFGEEEAAPKDEGLLTAEWIDYEIRVPGEPPERVRRQVFDLVGPAARSKGKAGDAPLTEESRLDRGLSLMGATDILPQVCHISAPFLDRYSLSCFLANRRPLLDLVLDSSPADAPARLRQAGHLVPMPGLVYCLAVIRFAWSPVDNSVYLDRPNVLSYHVGLKRAGSGKLVTQRALDIVQNAVAVLDGADAASVRLHQGVVDTSTEALAFGSGQTVVNAATAWGAYSGWHVIRPGTSDLLAKNAFLPADVRARIAKDLADGFAVMVPRQSLHPEASSEVVWWRVNPRTGQTLGLCSNGWGAALTEQEIMQINVGINLIVFLVCISYKAAYLKDISGTVFCCIGFMGGMTSFAFTNVLYQMMWNMAFQIAGVWG